MHVWSTSRYRFVAVASLAALTALATFDSRAAANETNAAPAIADAQFGVPPSGEVPILFNDHTVYATPDLLKRSRVLAALVRGHQIYVPLRSMFEQMGATVSASADGKTITASKPGANVSVTLGKSEVVINGESRPLDVPPMLYRARRNRRADRHPDGRADGDAYGRADANVVYRLRCGRDRGTEDV